MSNPTATHLVACLNPSGQVGVTRCCSYERAYSLAQRGKATYPDHEWIVYAIGRVPPKCNPRFDTLPLSTIATIH
jgi:hypothetical protein